MSSASGGRTWTRMFLGSLLATQGAPRRGDIRFAFDHLRPGQSYTNMRTRHQSVGRVDGYLEDRGLVGVVVKCEGIS